MAPVPGTAHRAHDDGDRPAGEPWADAPLRIRRRFAETTGDWTAVAARART